MKVRHLDARGKGKYLYDYDNDIANFKVKDKEYLKSIDFDNFIIDIDTKGYIIGIRIFDVSKIFKIDKIALKKMLNWEFNSRIEDNVLTFQLRFTCMLRNKQIVTQGEDFVRDAIDWNIKDSKVNCTA